MVAANIVPSDRNEENQNCPGIDLKTTYLEQFQMNLMRYAHRVASLAHPSRTDEILNKNMSLVNHYYQTIQELLQKIIPIFDELSRSVESIFVRSGTNPRDALVKRYLNAAFEAYRSGETGLFEYCSESNLCQLLIIMAHFSLGDAADEHEYGVLTGLYDFLGVDAFTALMILGKLDTIESCEKLFETILDIYSRNSQREVIKPSDLLGSVVLDILRYDPDSLLPILKKLASVSEILRNPHPDYFTYSECSLLFLKVCFEKSERDNTQPNPLNWVMKYEQTVKELRENLPRVKVVAAIWNGLSELIRSSPSSLTVEEILMIFKKDVKISREAEKNRDKRDRRNWRNPKDMFHQIRSDIMGGKIFAPDYKPEKPKTEQIKTPIPL